MKKPGLTSLNSEPRTSVIVPVYNSSDTIIRALSSLISQTDENFEVLVVDDGSQDDGFDKAKRLCRADSRFRFIGPCANAGPSAARNAGILRSKGEWIALLDADDAWTPDRLLQLHQYTSEADFVADDLELFDVVAGLSFGKMFHNFSNNMLTLDMHFADWPTKNADTGYLKPMMRHDFLIRLKLQYNTSIRHGEDYLLYARALMFGARFRLVPFSGYIYSVTIGPKSGKKSPFSHTVVNGSALASSLRQLLSEGGALLSAQQSRLLQLRAEVLERGGELQALKAALADWNSVEVVRALVQNSFLRRRLLEAARRRLGIARSLR